MKRNAGTLNRTDSVQGLKEKFARETCQEFLEYLDRKRQVLIILFQAAYDEELMLQDSWHQEKAEEPFDVETPTLKRLCVVARTRERLERALNLIDFGGDFGRFDIRFRKRLVEAWIQTSKLIKSSRMR